jgi:UDP-glucose 4-epimerase
VGGAITEATSPCPIAEYGWGHLRREGLLTEFARREPTLRTAVVRFSNLYGPGQRLDKPQGLVSQVSRAIIQRRPVHVYVPLDTVRDYLFAADAGVGLVQVLDRLTQTPASGGPPLVKLLASEEEVSVGGLLALFRQLTRRRVAVVAGISAVGRLQPPRMRFRSEVWVGAGRAQRTPLREGVFQVYRHQLDLFTQGRLPA